MSSRTVETATFLFSDVEGSTQLVRRLGDEYGHVLEQHRRILRAAFQSEGGREIDTQGDAFFIAFRTAAGAVRGAVEAQRELGRHEWSGDVAVRVRIGIHTGVARREDGRYHGVAVHRAARISAAAHGGQVLLSQTTRSLLEDEEGELGEISFADLGTHPLKDFDTPVRLYQAVAPGLRRQFPSIRRKPRSGTRKRRLVAGAAVLAACFAAAAALLFIGRDDHSSGVDVQPNSLVKIDPDTNRVAASIGAGTQPTALVIGDDAVWVLNDYDRTLTRADASGNATTSLTELDDPCCLARLGTNGVWVSGYGSRELKRFGGTSNRPEQTLRLDVLAHGTADFSQSPRLQSLAAAGAGSIWLLDENGALLRRVGTSGSRVIHEQPLDPSPFDVAFADGSAWVASYGGNSVIEIRASDHRVERIAVPGGPVALAVARDVIWTVSFPEMRVRRIERATGATTAVVDLGVPPPGASNVRMIDIAVGFGSVWVTVGSGALTRIDANSPSRKTTIELGHRAGVVAVGDDGVWLTVQDPIG